MWVRFPLKAQNKKRVGGEGGDAGSIPAEETRSESNRGRGSGEREFPRGGRQGEARRKTEGFPRSSIAPRPAEETRNSF